ncbi:MAG: hypothetical protein KIT36_04375, partial [Alphaproteobacteria bacterium]|nr:hypothetical protein [Alphaproteobacteria bacterium]
MLGLPLVWASLDVRPVKAEDDIQGLRHEMQQMRQQYDAALKKLERDYGARLKQMEQRLDAAQRTAVAAQT